MILVKVCAFMLSMFGVVLLWIYQEFKKEEKRHKRKEEMHRKRKAPYNWL